MQDNKKSYDIDEMNQEALSKKENRFLDLNSNEMFQKYVILNQLHQIHNQNKSLGSEFKKMSSDQLLKAFYIKKLQEFQNDILQDNNDSEIQQEELLLQKFQQQIQDDQQEQEPSPIKEQKQYYVNNHIIYKNDQYNNMNQNQFQEKRAENRQQFYQPKPIENQNFIKHNQFHNSFKGIQKPNSNQIFCKCKKTKCLKLYCDCLANGQLCNENCICNYCKNNSSNQDIRTHAIESILKRDPLAFNSKVQNIKEVQIHNKGCNCKKSNCLKKYCECFVRGLKCTKKCRCDECKNTRDQLVNIKNHSFLLKQLKQD